MPTLPLYKTTKKKINKEFIISALSADEMAVRLDITEKWKTFEELWNRRNMYRDYYKAFNQEGTIIDVSG